jgi:uncharacterized membrane protein YhaH (DUF805 family)
MNWVGLLLSPQGRITRAPFWFGIMVVIAASLALNLISGPAGRLLGLLLLWPQICINVKRLHDMGRTGWLLLVPMVIGIACVVIGFVMGSGAEAMPRPAPVPLAVAGLVSLAFLLWVGLTPGKPGANRFGEAP